MRSATWQHPEVLKHAELLTRPASTCPKISTTHVRPSGSTTHPAVGELFVAYVAAGQQLFYAACFPLPWISIALTVHSQNAQSKEALTVLLSGCRRPPPAQADRIQEYPNYS